MSKRRPRVERRLIVVSKRRTPTDEGLGRLVAALVLHRLVEQQRRQLSVEDGGATDVEATS